MSKIQRAALACLRCRSRRVRCDVTQKHESCTNCLLDGADCRVVERKRRRQVPLSSQKQSTSCDAVDSLAKQQQNDWASQTAKTFLFTSVRRSSPDSGSPSGHHRREQSGPSETTAAPRGADLHTGDIGSRNAQSTLSEQNASRNKTNSPQDGSLTGARQTFPPMPLQISPFEDSSRWRKTLPQYIKAFTLSNPDDLDHLRRSAVFVLPPHQLQDIILERYAEFVHPLLPVLDLQDFRSILANRKSWRTISLLLYHAVMFAGVGAVESDIVLRQAGMPKIAARQLFYEKAKTLFNLDVEQDRIVLCQASLLLLGWASKSEIKDSTFWLGNAIAQAYRLRLNRLDQRGPAKLISQQEQNLQRRLWWCILMKECDLCTYKGQPPRVWPFGTTMLNLKDFGQAEESQLEIDSTGDSLQQTGNLSLKQALICIQKAKLSTQIYSIMRLMQEDAFFRLKGQMLHNPLPALQQHMIQELGRWHSEIPSCLHYGELFQWSLNTSERSLVWAMSVVELIYWTSHALIYRDEIAINDVSHHVRVDDVLEGYPKSEYSRHCLRQAAAEITAILEKLQIHDLAKFLPPSSLLNVCVALATFFREFDVANPESRKAILPKIDICITASKSVADLGPAMQELVATILHIRAACQVLPATTHLARIRPDDRAPSGTRNLLSNFENECEVDHRISRENSSDVLNTETVEPVRGSCASIAAPASESQDFYFGETFDLDSLPMFGFDRNGYTWA